MKTLYIKVLVVASVFNLGTALSVIGSYPSLFVAVVVLLLFLTGLFVPFVIQYNSLSNRLIIERPKWSDKLNHKVPLTYTHFLSYLLLSGGSGVFLGTLVRTWNVSPLGIALISLGIGIMVGNQLAIKNRRFATDALLSSSVNS